jgi:hypothetical protein
MDIRAAASRGCIICCASTFCWQFLLPSTTVESAEIRSDDWPHPWMDFRRQIFFILPMRPALGFTNGRLCAPAEPPPPTTPLRRRAHHGDGPRPLAKWQNAPSLWRGVRKEMLKRYRAYYSATAAAPLRVSTTLTPDFSRGVAPNLRRSAATSGRYRRGI